MQGHKSTPEARYRAAAGAVVRRLRTDAGGSLREFAEQVGVAHTSLHAVERGDTTPTVDTLARIGESRGLELPAMLALIVDAIDDEPAGDEGSLSRLLSAAAALTAEQVNEVLGFIDFITFRDRDA